MSAKKDKKNSSADIDRLCKEFGIPPAPPPPPPKRFSPAPGIDCYCCDFRRLPVKPGSADAICTDIPWASDWLPHVEEFSEWCAKVLKPGGIMATWYGASGLDRLMERLGRHLYYQWTFISPSAGGTQIKSRFIQARYTPCLIYSNVPNVRLHRATDDWCPASRREKGLHPHQRALAPVQFVVEAVAEPESLVVDPCSGGWTTARACFNSGRKFLGSDNRANCLDLARRRFANVSAA